MCADVYVYNVGSGDQVLARRFRADNGQERHQAHAVANAVLLAVTGVTTIWSGMAYFWKNRALVVRDW